MQLLYQLIQCAFKWAGNVQAFVIVGASSSLPWTCIHPWLVLASTQSCKLVRLCDSILPLRDELLASGLLHSSP